MGVLRKRDFSRGQNKNFDLSGITEGRFFYVFLLWPLTNQRSSNFQSLGRLLLVILSLIRIPPGHNSDLWRYLQESVLYERGLSGIWNAPFLLLPLFRNEFEPLVPVRWKHFFPSTRRQRKFLMDSIFNMLLSWRGVSLQLSRPPFGFLLMPVAFIPTSTINFPRRFAWFTGFRKIVLKPEQNSKLRPNWPDSFVGLIYLFSFNRPSRKHSSRSKLFIR